MSTLKQSEKLTALLAAKGYDAKKIARIGKGKGRSCKREFPTGYTFLPIGEDEDTMRAVTTVHVPAVREFHPGRTFRQRGHYVTVQQERWEKSELSGRALVDQYVRQFEKLNGLTHA